MRRMVVYKPSGFGRRMARAAVPVGLNKQLAVGQLTIGQNAPRMKRVTHN